MLLWLNGGDNSKDSPNENYGREMMELFTLGHGSGYTETDVRQQARALTGFRYDWKRNDGPANFRYDASYHDTGVKTIFGARAVHVEGLVPALRQPSRRTRRSSCRSSGATSSRCRRTPRRSARCSSSTSRAGYEMRPVVEAILRHPALFDGPRLVKPPVVYTAGLLRRIRRAIDTSDWTWLDSMAGQQLFYPPNVAGWDDTRWLDTATVARPLVDRAGRARPVCARSRARRRAVRRDRSSSTTRSASGMSRRSARRRARRSRRSRSRALGDAAGAEWKKQQYPPMVANALRHLIAVSPELQAA